MFENVFGPFGRSDLFFLLGVGSHDSERKISCLLFLRAKTTCCTVFLLEYITKSSIFGHRVVRLLWGPPSLEPHCAWAPTQNDVKEGVGQFLITKKDTVCVAKTTIKIHCWLAKKSDVFKIFGNKFFCNIKGMFYGLASVSWLWFFKKHNKLWNHRSTTHTHTPDQKSDSEKNKTRVRSHGHGGESRF